MIKIKVQENKVILNVLISGHANYDDYGKDIVCASVSSIVITAVNSILSIDSKAIFYEEKDGYLKIENLKQDDITNKLLNNLVNLLEELSIKYPKNINMKRGE